MKAPTIETERLSLKALTLADAGDLYAYRSDPEVYRYQSWKPASLAEAREFIKRYTKGFGVEDTWFQFGIHDKNGTALIGDLGLHFLGPANAQVEIGFTIARPWQRKGYGREAVMAVVGYLFASMKKHRIIASVHPDNAASIALLESVGLRKEGVFRQSVLTGGAWEDDVIYAILAEEWGGLSRGIRSRVDSDLLS